LLVGIILTTAVATIVNWATDYTAFTQPGVARWPDDIAQSPNFGLVGEFSFDAFATIGVITTIALVFSLFLADFFDTMGTLVGVGKQAGYLTKDGELPEIRRPLLVDSLAAVAGGAASSSSATTYIESGAGVGVGGRTGWVAVVAGALFFPFMFFAPLIGMVPAQATAPALIIVGWLMITALTESEERAERGGTVDRKIAGIDFHDFAIGLSAALTIMIMPFTYSITNGIGFGFIAYVVIRIAQGEMRRVHPLMYAAAGAFALYFLIPLLHDNLSWI
jgi:AGZA family xanthine/uracil permease-like MFS transporter